MLENGARAERPAAWMERVGRNAASIARASSSGAPSWRRRSNRRRARDPETALLARERRGLVRRALALLPRPQRRAALLRFPRRAAVPDGRRAPRHAGGHGAHARPARADQPARAPRIAARDVPDTGRAGDGPRADRSRARNFPAASPMALAMAGDDIVTAERPHGRRMRLVAVPPAAVATETAKTPPAHEEPRPDAATYPSVQVFNFEDEKLMGRCRARTATSIARCPG
jgi:hypothetical protein